MEDNDTQEEVVVIKITPDFGVETVSADGPDWSENDEIGKFLKDVIGCENLAWIELPKFRKELDGQTVGLDLWMDDAQSGPGNIAATMLARAGGWRGYGIIRGTVVMMYGVGEQCSAPLPVEPAREVVEGFTETLKPFIPVP